MKDSIDYLQIWKRWVGLFQLSEEDRKDLHQRLHEEVQAGIDILANVALEEMKLILKDIEFAKKEKYMESAQSILVFSVFGGYSFFLLTKGINPLEVGLKERKTTEKLGEKWMEQFEKDQNEKYLEKINPIFGLMMTRMYELRVNQLLAAHPEIVELAYKAVEGLNQYVNWAIRQGFILGMMEKELD